MNSLTNWDPFRDLWNMRSMVDRMFENALDRQSGSWQPVEWGLALDVTENEEEFTVKASVPGINPDDLEITFTDGTLTIKGETREEKTSKRPTITYANGALEIFHAASRCHPTWTQIKLKPPMTPAY